MAPTSPHTKKYPIHIYGLRFLILSQDGQVNDNFVWKDTMPVPAGSTIDVLLVVDNRGLWLIHCNILEHIDVDMQYLINVG